MNPQILLIGRTGQIGGDLMRLLPDVGTVVAPERDALDLSKPEHIRRAIAEARPHWIVNAAAYTAVDQAESDAVSARAINAVAPGVIAEEAQKLGAWLVHYSTDYVFDGVKKSPYVESDAANPLNVYGQTKLEGENVIRKSGAFHFILRTAWVYTTRGKNFLLTVLRLATQQEELRIVCDQIGAPTWSREIASATEQIMRLTMQKQTDRTLQELSGTYHMTASGDTNWADFARATLEETSALPKNDRWLSTVTNTKPLIARRVTSISTAEYPTAARRPAYSVLSNARLSAAFGISLPDWRTQLKSALAHRNE
jgi:dTDP-4-dehydrorhamnose reductase